MPLPSGRVVNLQPGKMTKWRPGIPLGIWSVRQVCGEGIVISRFLPVKSPGGAAFDPGRRVMGEFGGVLEIQLLLQLLAVILDGLDAQVKLVGYLPCALPL